MRALRMILGLALVGPASVVGCGLVLGVNPDYGLQCDAQKPCDDADPCTDDACGDNGVCVFTSREGEPCVGEAGPGTCRSLECVPPCSGEPPGCDDMNSCTEDTCDPATDHCKHDGSKLAGTKCGAGGLLTCNAAGSCIQCADASECGKNDACNTYTCESSICKRVTSPAGTPATDATPGDCMSPQCDGMGNEVLIANPADTSDDNNDCTADVCVNGDRSHQNLVMGAPCTSPTGGTACDGLGVCRKAQGDKCVAAADCATGLCVDTYCCNTACTDTCMSCGTAAALGTCSLIGLNAKDGFPANTCNGLNACDGMGTCKLARSSPCTMGSECVDGFCVDGVCCNNACSSACKSCNVPGLSGTCSNQTIFMEDTYPSPLCVAPKTCNGAGACKKANGQTCTLGTECASGVCAGGPPTVCQ